MAARVTQPDPAPVRSYKRRGSRVTPGQAEALQRCWPQLGFVVQHRPLDAAALFGRAAPLVVEIGFGMGEATAEMAAARPDLDVIAVDVHPPGQGALLREVTASGLTNVRVADGDAHVLLTSMLPETSVHEVRIFFPDPWPKQRHWKRRLLTDEFLSLLAVRLVPGALVHVATDWAPYAGQVRRLVIEHPAFDLVEDIPWRARTRFEQQALAAGRSIHEIASTRR